MKYRTIIVISIIHFAIVAARNDSYPELPIPVKECPHWFDIRTDYVANNFVNEKYQVQPKIYLVIVFLVFNRDKMTSRGFGMSTLSRTPLNHEAHFAAVQLLTGVFCPKKQVKPRKVW